VEVLADEPTELKLIERDTGRETSISLEEAESGPQSIQDLASVAVIPGGRQLDDLAGDRRTDLRALLREETACVQ
jgi:hypothetical protein